MRTKAMSDAAKSQAQLAELQANAPDRIKEAYERGSQQVPPARGPPTALVSICPEPLNPGTPEPRNP